MTCSVEGCSNKAHQRSLCQKHGREWRAANPDKLSGMARKDLTLLERLEGRYEVDADGCWLWTGYVSKQGYGKITVSSMQTGPLSVHVVAYLAWHGEIPKCEGVQISVDHVCHNLDKDCPGGWKCKHRRCINPNHLRAVSQSENLRSGRKVGRKKKT